MASGVFWWQVGCLLVASGDRLSLSEIETVFFFSSVPHDTISRAVSILTSVTVELLGKCTPRTCIVGMTARALTGILTAERQVKKTRIELISHNNIIYWPFFGWLWPSPWPFFGQLYFGWLYFPLPPPGPPLASLSAPLASLGAPMARIIATGAGSTILSAIILCLAIWAQFISNRGALSS